MNVNRIFDEYSSEDYLCNKTKPRGELLCLDCHRAYLTEWDDLHNCECCTYCGSMNDPYEET